MFQIMSRMDLFHHPFRTGFLGLTLPALLPSKEVSELLKTIRTNHIALSIMNGEPINGARSRRFDFESANGGYTVHFHNLTSFEGALVSISGVDKNERVKEAYFEIDAEGALLNAQRIHGLKLNTRRSLRAYNTLLKAMRKVEETQRDEIQRAFSCENHLRLRDYFCLTLLKPLQVDKSFEDIGVDILHKRAQNLFYANKSLFSRDPDIRYLLERDCNFASNAKRFADNAHTTCNRLGIDETKLYAPHHGQSIENDSCASLSGTRLSLAEIIL